MFLAGLGIATVSIVIFMGDLAATAADPSITVQPIGQ